MYGFYSSYCTLSLNLYFNFHFIIKISSPKIFCHVVPKGPTQLRRKTRKKGVDYSLSLEEKYRGIVLQRFKSNSCDVRFWELES